MRSPFRTALTVRRLLGVKACVTCQEAKHASEFHKSQKAKDGLQSRCKRCKAEHGKQWRSANADRNRANKRNWEQSNRERVREYCRRWYRDNPAQNQERSRLYLESNRDKFAVWAKRWRQANDARMAPTDRARQAVYRAIKRGILVRPSVCEECGDTRTIQAAHYDYQDLLRVRWLCRPCHTKWDRAQPKTAADCYAAH